MVSQVWEVNLELSFPASVWFTRDQNLRLTREPVSLLIDDRDLLPDFGAHMGNNGLDVAGVQEGRLFEPHVGDGAHTRVFPLRHQVVELLLRQALLDASVDVLKKTPISAASRQNRIFSP